MEAEELVATVFIDERSMITRVNREFQKLFGWNPEEIVGRPLAVIIPESMRDLHHKGFARLVGGGEPRLLNQPIRLPALTKNGREFMAEHFILGERRDGRWVFGAAIRELAQPYNRP